jgi:hypothetical protein
MFLLVNFWFWVKIELAEHFPKSGVAKPARPSSRHEHVLRRGMAVEKCRGALNFIIESEYLHFSEFMKLTPIFKFPGHLGAVVMLVLLLGLGANNVAQAWQPQAARISSIQPVPGTVQIQHAVIIPPGLHHGHANLARVELPFPPCYSVDYKSGPNCYCDQPGQTGAAIGVHMFSN